VNAPPADFLSSRRLSPLARLATWDPNYLHSVHALKTVCAILLFLGLYHGQPLRVRLIGATATGFIMQCLGCGNRRSQMGSMVGAAAVLALCVHLATTPAVPVQFQEALVVAVAVGVVWARRLLPGHPTFPMMLFSLTLISSAFAVSNEQAHQEVASVLVALAIAFTLYFLILPRLVAQPVQLIPLWRTGWRSGLAAVLALTLHHLCLWPGFDGLTASGAERLAQAARHLLEVQYGFWAVLVAVLVNADKREDHRRKAWERLAMTGAGGLLGVALHLASWGIWQVQLVFMLISVALAVFFRDTSYRMLNFFITVYVMMLFSVMDVWSMHLIAVRVAETALGCLASLLAAIIIPYADAPGDPGPPSAPATIPTPSAPSATPLETPHA
jgi:uncharacterized membrane protein YccC